MNFNYIALLPIPPRGERSIDTKTFIHGGNAMSIWKELTKPTSFAGQYDTAVEVLAPADRAPRPDGPLANINKRESVIGPGVVIEGTISGNGDIRVAGNIKGDVGLKGSLTIDAGGQIVGAVNADHITLGGIVEGNIHAAGNATLLATGQLMGDLKAKFLAAAHGSRMRGKIEFGWDEPEIKTVEREKPAEHKGLQLIGGSNPE
jgi:cytoskeletal protein CcmA (bactofilin family)